MIRARAIAIVGVAIVGLGALTGCRRPGGRARRAIAPLIVGGARLDHGVAHLEGGVLRIVLAPGPIGCDATAPSSAIVLRLPAGPRGDHFVGETIGVRLEARGLGDRPAFGLDAEEVELRLARGADPRALTGRLAFAERYRRQGHHGVRGRGAFTVALCDEPRGDLPATGAPDRPGRAIAHVVTLPDGGRALTRLRFEDPSGGFDLLHPAFAADGRARTGVAGPARARGPDGAISWDAWASFDALDLAPGGRIRGELGVRLGAQPAGRAIGGAFEAVVED